MFTIEPEFLPNSALYVEVIDLESENGVDGWLEVT